MLLHQVLHEEPRPPRKLNNHVPRDLETICLRAMAKEPGRRYQKAGEIGDDLRRFLDRRADRGPAGQSCRAAVALVPAQARLGGCLALGLLVLIGLIAVPVAFYLNEARYSGNLAVEQEKTLAALKASKRQAATSTLQEAQLLCEQGEIDRGVLRLTQGLKNLERGGGRGSPTGLPLEPRRLVPRDPYPNPCVAASAAGLRGRHQSRRPTVGDRLLRRESAFLGRRKRKAGRGNP